MTRPGRRWVLLLLALRASAGLAQPAMVQHLDQTAYFATPEAELTARQALLAQLTAFSARADPAEPFASVEKGEGLLLATRRHFAYLHLRAALDVEDQAATDARNELDRAATQVAISINTALRSVSDEGFARAIALKPGLGRFAYARRQALRSAPHELPAQQQDLLDAIAQPQAATLWKLYQQTIRTTPFATLPTPAGEKNVEGDARALALEPDRALREAAWRQRWAGYASRAELYAGLLLGVVRLNDTAAKLQHFAGAPEQVYFERELDRPSVDDAIAAVGSRAEISKRYQQLRNEHAAALLGVSEAHSWDRAVPPPGFTPPVFTIEQARAAAAQALAPLGPDYVARFRALLDPAGGRMDFSTETGKRVDDAFSVHAPGVKSGLFIGRFAANYRSIRAIVHEGGHAIHGELRDEGAASALYDQGPNWLSEAVAIFNQLLLSESLAKTSTGPAAKAFYLEALLDDLTHEIFTSAEEGEFEEALYDRVRDGAVKNAQDLDALCLEISSKYQLGLQGEPARAQAWITRRLMFEDPVYLVNYLFAGLVAGQLFELSSREPAAFRVRYLAFLREGFDAPPAELLQRLLGRAFSPRAMLEADAALIGRKTDELAKLYRQLEAPPPRR